MAIGNSNTESTEMLQAAIAKVQSWTRKRRIKLNETKSVHIDFTNKRIEHKQIYINRQLVPYENTAKHLGMTLMPNSDGNRMLKKHTEIQKNVLVSGSLFCPICI